jgi:uncharacterized RDD family membrane protein YckC
MSDPAAAPPPPPEGAFTPPPAAGGVPGAGLALSGPGKRLGAALLDGLLFIVTLGIGWLIWWIICWQTAQSPAKRILKMRIVRLDENRPLAVGEMAMRELVGKWLLGFIPFYSFVGALFVIFDDNNQALWDKVASSTVVEDPDNQFGL